MSIVNNHYVYVLDFERNDEYNDFTSYHTANQILKRSHLF